MLLAILFSEKAELQRQLYPDLPLNYQTSSTMYHHRHFQLIYFAQKINK